MKNISDQLYHIAVLLAKKSQNTLTESEKVELDKWKDTSPENRHLYELWKDRNRLSELFLEYDAINHHVAQNRAIRLIRKNVRRRRWMRIAASAAACIAIAAGIISIPKSNPECDYLVAQSDSDVPVLILDDGTQVPVDDRFDQNAIAGNVRKSEQTSLIYNADSNEENERVTYHTILLPKGTRADVVLPDGSHVWLNAGSQLRYPTRFLAGQRSVELIGEAYFDVVSQPERPFRVELADAAVIVMGTQFNVANYGDGWVSATLVQGSINFESETENVTLLHNQHLTYNIVNKEINIEYVVTKRYTEWKNNKFFFDGETLINIAAVFERWYDVEFVFESPELRNLRLSVNVSRDENLRTLLDLFEKGANISFTANDRKVTVKKII